MCWAVDEVLTPIYYFTDGMFSIRSAAAAAAGRHTHAVHTEEEGGKQIVTR